MSSFIARIQRRRLRRALTRLTRLQRDVFLYSSADDLPYDAIAERLAITPREVERQLACALAGLRRAMDRDPIGRLARLARSPWQSGLGKRRE